MFDLGSLQAKITADDSQFKQTLAGAGQAADGFAGGTLAKITALSTGFLAVTAAAEMVYDATKKIVEGAWELARVAAGVEEQMEALQSSAAQYGTSVAQIAGALQQAAGGVISFAEGLQAASRGLAMGLDPKQMEELMAAAETLADRIGGETTDAFNTLTAAIATGRTSQLKLMGVMIDSKEAYEEYAESIHKTVAQLTSQEERQAMVNALMAQTARITANANASATSAADAFDMFYAAIKDVATIAGMVISNLLKMSGAYDAIAWAAEKAAAFVRDLSVQQQWNNSLGGQREKLEQKLLDLAKRRDKLASGDFLGVDTQALAQVNAEIQKTVDLKNELKAQDLAQRSPPPLATAPPASPGGGGGGGEKKWTLADFASTPEEIEDGLKEMQAFYDQQIIDSSNYWIEKKRIRDEALAEEAAAIAEAQAQQAISNAEEFERQNEFLNSWGAQLASAMGMSQETILAMSEAIKKGMIMVGDAAESSIKAGAGAAYDYLAQTLIRTGNISKISGQQMAIAFQQAAGQAILSVGQRAAMEALWEFAQGVAKYATSIWPPNPAAALSAQGHFQAAALYGSIAAVAGGVGVAMSAGATNSRGLGAGGGGDGGGRHGGKGNGGTDDIEQANQQRYLHLEVHGNLIGQEEYVIGQLIPTINKAVMESDAVMISTDSRAPGSISGVSR